ncbi:MAG: stage II sporulation protein M [Pseudomonadota bacterium]
MVQNVTNDDMDALLIRSARFRKEREEDWRQLEALVKRAERSGLAGFTLEETQTLSSLYRRGANALALARTISLDAGLLTYLENLTTRAWIVVHSNREPLRAVLAGFFQRTAPAAIRRCTKHIALAALFFFLGAIIGYALVISEPNWFYTFVNGGLAGNRNPDASAETLRSTLFSDRETFLERLSTFASYLFTHNTRVAFLALALGILMGAPTALLLLYNGLILGAFFAIFAAKDLAWELFGWLSIHGVTEIAAIIIAGAAGLRMGQAMLFPGLDSRAHALREAGKDVGRLAIIAMLMLLAAALLEGFARQLIQETTVRLAIGWSIGGLWLLWFLKGLGQGGHQRHG